MKNVSFDPIVLYQILETLPILGRFYKTHLYKRLMIRWEMDTGPNIRGEGQRGSRQGSRWIKGNQKGGRTGVTWTGPVEQQDVDPV